MSLKQLFEDQRISELKKANQKSLGCREATDTLCVLISFVTSISTCQPWPHLPTQEPTWLRCGRPGSGMPQVHPSAPLLTQHLLLGHQAWVGC